MKASGFASGLARGMAAVGFRGALRRVQRLHHLFGGDGNGRRLLRAGSLFRRFFRIRTQRGGLRRHDAAPDILRLFAVHRIHKIPPSVHFMKAVFRACADGSNCFKKMPETPSN